VSLSSGATTQTHTYDAEGRFVACDDTTAGTPRTPISSVTHDALGRISSLTVHGGGGLPPETTNFVYDGFTCIQELTDPGGTGTLDPNLNFVSADGIKVCISTRNGSLYYPHSSGGSHASADSTGALTYIGPCDASFTATSDHTGAIIERIAYDDACKPIFLDTAGLPSSSSSSSSGLRWLTPESVWEPACSLYLCPDGTFAPDFASTASTIMGGGHVTVLKAAAHRGHVTVLKAAAHRGHVTVLKAAATGGGGGGSSKAQDHNSSRSNKSS
jgi:hypothetical protein